jgi:hypothetical protein
MSGLAEDRSIGIHNIGIAHFFSKLVPSIIVPTGSTPDQYLHVIVHAGTAEIVRERPPGMGNGSGGGVPGIVHIVERVSAI